MCYESVNYNNNSNNSNNSTNSNKRKDNNFIADPSLKIDHVHLKVHDLQKSIDFYRSILGFRVLENSSMENMAFLVSQELGQDNRSSLLVLNQIDDDNNKITSQPSNINREAGLYHFAILLPERKYLSSFLQHIQNNLDPQYYEGMADHAVSESLYLHDPDSNGIEVYRDRKLSEWVWTSANKVYMVTEPLDINNLLNHKSYGTWRGFPSKTSIGHVHLYVSNLPKAKNFYHDLLGLYHTASYPGAYFFAADRYHHHIATNTWRGTNILSNSANISGKPGLDHFAIRVPYKEKVKNPLKSHLMANGIFIDEKLPDSDLDQHSSFYVYDYDGIKIQFIFS